MAVIGYAMFVEAQPVKELPPSIYDERIIQLDKLALEDAYRTQVEHLFAVWMKDEQGQPERATKGVRQARRAYIEAMEAIERRAK